MLHFPFLMLIRVQKKKIEEIQNVFREIVPRFEMFDSPMSVGAASRGKEVTVRPVPTLQAS